MKDRVRTSLSGEDWVGDIAAELPLRRPRVRMTRRALVAALATVTAIAGSIAVDLSPAGAAALTNVTWSVSNNQVSATSVNYSYSFKTAATGSIKTITFAVSGAGLAGTPAIVKNFGVPSGTVARVGQTITYTVTTPVSVTAGLPLYLEFSGLTNSSTLGAYTTNITTANVTPATIDGPTTSSTVTLAATSTAVNVAVDKSLTFTLDTTSFQLAMDPSLAALADQTQVIGITVLTNANSGYTLTVNDNATGLQSSGTGSPTIARASVGKANSLAWPGAGRFGYTVTATGATADTAFASSKYAGYTSAGEQIASHSGPTGGTPDTITITDRVAIDYSTATGDYTDTVTYTVTPNYS